MISELNKSRLLVMGAVLLFAVFAVAVYALRIEPYWLRVTPLTVNSPRLPADFAGLKLVFVSDIHFGIMFDEKRLAELTQRINEQKPDLVILGGDQIAPGENAIERFYRNFASQVEAPVYAVLGNHDYINYSNAWSMIQMAHCGIFLLDNRAYDLTAGKAKIRLAGVGDMWMGTQNLRPAIRDLSDDTFLLLVTHNPDYGDHLGKYGRRVDLMLAGHLHGHQVNVLPASRPHRRVKGHRYGRVQLNERGFAFITSGAGTSNLPMRFLARPEIVVINITSG